MAHFINARSHLGVGRDEIRVYVFTVKRKERRGSGRGIYQTVISTVAWRDYRKSQYGWRGSVPENRTK
jgi:hypothetical protein